MLLRTMQFAALGRPSSPLASARPAPDKRERSAPSCPLELQLPLSSPAPSQVSALTTHPQGNNNTKQSLQTQTSFKMQFKATIILTTLAVFAAAHDGHDSSVPHTTTVSATKSAKVTDICWSDIDPEASSSSTKGYHNSTTTGKATLYTSTTIPTDKPAATSSKPPASTGGAGKSEFAMAILGLGLAAGLIL